MKYRVEPFDCDTWNVVDPNGNVCCQRDDEEDAKTEAHAFNRAYELGEAAALTARDAALERARVLEAVVKDMQSGFRYVRQRMKCGEEFPWYGFGIDRLEKAADNALGGEQ